MRHPDHRSQVDHQLRAWREAIDTERALDVLDDAIVVAGELCDAELDGLLVELRHAAFDQLPKTPGRPQWPGTFADPFPGEVGLPVASPPDLSGPLLGGALTHHGCLRVDGLVDPDTAETLRLGIDDAFAARDHALSDAEAPAMGSPSSYVPFEVGQAKAKGFGAGEFVRTVDSPQMLRAVAQVFARSGTRDAVTEYLGERPTMIANKWSLRRSPSGKIGTDFHQDGAFLGEGIRTIDCWIALSHCGPGTGRPAIDLIPRRFDGLIEGHESAFSWSITQEDVHDAAAGAPLLSPVFAPGDALFFDELLPHRTTVGLDLGPRYAIESWFVAPSSFPAKHTPVVL